jgi:hypothetical protein
MPKIKEAWLFYTGLYEPETPEEYHGLISCFKKKGFKTHIINIEKQPMLAEKFNIIVSPVFVVKKGTHTEKYVGNPEELKKILV